MIIVTTPMCEGIVKFAGIKDYKVNKNPDNEKGDLAILLSENKVKMNSLNIKLNTFSQIKDSIIKVSKYSPNGVVSENEIDDIFSDYKLANKWLNKEKKIKTNKSVKVYSKFLKDIVEDIDFEIKNNDYDYIIVPDYLKDKINSKDNEKLIEIPTHSNVPLDPIERAELRYSILEKIIY